VRAPGRRAWPGGSALLALVVAVSAGCYTTVDSLGYDAPGGAGIKHLSGPATYPNAFRDVLGKSDAEIAAKIAAAFAQLFHGDPTTQAIYYIPPGTDQAYIFDSLHGDIRTEGVGLAMIVAVQLDKRDEFDHLWRYAKGVLQVSAGAAEGYFTSSCDTLTTPAPCLDPFGMEQFVTALLFANDRWSAAPPTLDYAGDASALLTVMRHKQDENGGVSGGVTDVFDTRTRLVFDVPNVSAAGVGRPSIEMPAYYELWTQATGDPFWTASAARARAYWTAVAHPTTGLIPVRANFDGTSVAGWSDFRPEAYRTQINMVLDAVWFGHAPWEVAESDRLLGFFAGAGIDQYCKAYTLAGDTCLDPTHDSSVVVANGVTALISTAPIRTTFIQAVWDLDVPTGLARYYGGILELVGLLILSGQYRVY
jgi:oligosaccharide reducing-end xylanase